MLMLEVLRVDARILIASAFLPTTRVALKLPAPEWLFAVRVSLLKTLLRPGIHWY